jgi:hypothetical protein
MNSQVRIRRSRGAVCGVALILLGLWGGLAPFVGPYFHFGFTPDKAWAYTTGRLYLSAVPGGAAVLGGLFMMVTRSRFLAVTGGLLGAVAGAWFVAGSGITLYVVKSTTISAGTPLDIGSGGAERTYFETLALFAGVGALIIFAAALGCGRVSILAAKDMNDVADATYYPDYQGASASIPEPAEYPSTQFPATSTGQFPAASTGEFPTVSRFPDSPTGRFTDSPSGQFPTAAGQFPASSDQYTQTSATPPPGAAPFPDAPNPYSPDNPGQ